MNNKNRHVSIISITDGWNYGNRLQSYALSKKINDLGFTPENQWQATVKQTIIIYIKQLLSFSRKPQRSRSGNFNKFTNRLIKPKYTNTLDFNSADYYIAGSDQVWNSTFTGFKDYFLLKDVDPQKRISYAASFGINNVPEKDRLLFKNELMKFKYLSVREDRGKEIIKELTGRKDVEVNIDPTMLLTANEWDRVSKKPKQLKTNHFILSYFLGKQSEERRKEIERIAKENNCMIINILDENDPFFTCGPSEFLYLEKHAFLICTDSFHSSVFAFLYNRPFVIYEREDNDAKMNSRLETLVKKFKLNNRYYNGNMISDKNLKHDYREGYKVLELERKKSDNYLRKALDVED